MQFFHAYFSDKSAKSTLFEKICSFICRAILENSFHFYVLSALFSPPCWDIIGALGDGAMTDDIRSRIVVKQGDITKEDTDAIVNAANSSLLGGGGVDGAIHRAAGPELVKECATLGGCAPGNAKTTKGYRLPAKFVIHTVGPVWHGGTHGEEETLASAYRNSLSEAVRAGAKTVAFPAISTGVYHFPAELAAKIAVATVADFLSSHSAITEVRLVCFSAESARLHEEALKKL